MKKLKQSDIKAYREDKLREQNNIDPIANIHIERPVLDHSHENGFVRSVLQNEINVFEGKVYNSYKRYVRHLGVTFTDVLKGLLQYHERDYSMNPLHPSFKTPDEKRIRRNLRATRRRNRDVTEFKKLNAEEQRIELNFMACSLGEDFKECKNATERVALFRKLNAKT